MRNKKTCLILTFLVFFAYSFLSVLAASEMICKPFEIRCRDGILEQCNSLGEKWVYIDKCAYGCAGNKCDSGMMFALYWIIGVNAITFTIAGFIYMHNKRKNIKP